MSHATCKDRWAVLSGVRVGEKMMMKKKVGWIRSYVTARALRR